MAYVPDPLLCPSGGQKQAVLLTVNNGLRLSLLTVNNETATTTTTGSLKAGSTTGKRCF
jgi:uncharacterized membrane protein YjjB (DUF3815 family)